MAASIVSALPAWIWARLPARTASGLRSFARRHAEARLPVVAVNDLANVSLPRRWSGTPKAELLRAYSGYTVSSTLSPTSRGLGLPVGGITEGGEVLDSRLLPGVLGPKEHVPASPLHHVRPD